MLVEQNGADPIENLRNALQGVRPRYGFGSRVVNGIDRVENAERIHVNYLGRKTVAKKSMRKCSLLP
jgi:ribosomal protein S7